MCEVKADFKPGNPYPPSERELLEDILKELKKLNSVIQCVEFKAIPSWLRTISLEVGEIANKGGR